MPFVCNYCKGVFCADHRLPEFHNCEKLDVVRVPGLIKKNNLSLIKGKTRSLHRSGRIEIQNLLIAWLVLSFCFSLRFFWGALSFFPQIFIISLSTAGIGFIIHELMHKFSAQRYGHWAEFRVWPLGLVMALIISIASAGNFIFAAPGATYILPRSHTWSAEVDKKQNAFISLAGPLSNAVLALLFYILMLSSTTYWPWFIGWMGLQVNLWLAAFNMIPFGNIDGRKIYSWSSIVWALVAIPLWLGVFVLFFA